MCVQDIHKVAQLFVRKVGRLYPQLLWVCILHELCQINDPAQQVAQPVQVFDDRKQLRARLPGTQDTICKQLRAN
jgi:hypothetical protein